MRSSVLGAFMGLILEGGGRFVTRNGIFAAFDLVDPTILGYKSVWIYGRTKRWTAMLYNYDWFGVGPIALNIEIS